MPKQRTEIAKKLIKDSGISAAKIAKELGFKNREGLYYHFKKEEDIDIDLFMKIITKLREKGTNIDNSIIQTINGDKGMKFNASNSKTGPITENNYYHDQELITQLSKTIDYLRDQNARLQTELDAIRKKK